MNICYVDINNLIISNLNKNKKVDLFKILNYNQRNPAEEHNCE